MEILALEICFATTESSMRMLYMGSAVDVGGCYVQFLQKTPSLWVRCSIVWWWKASDVNALLPTFVIQREARN